MLPDWQPDPTTQYADFSYRDLLQTAQDLDAVWDGNTPRANAGFAHGEYFRGPDDEILDNGTITVNVDGMPQSSIDPRVFGVLLDNHNLIASSVPENTKALDTMRDWINQ